jgi:hypothetical protein
LNLPDPDSNDKKDTDNHDSGIEGSKFNNDNNNNKKPNIDGGRPVDPRFKRLLWSMIVSTRGGINRAKVINFLIESPSNANQVSVQLKLDYKTVIHHLNVLKKNSLIVTDNEDSYGATYFISPLLEKNYSAFKEIMDRIGKK